MVVIAGAAALWFALWYTKPSPRKMPRNPTKLTPSQKAAATRRRKRVAKFHRIKKTALRRKAKADEAARKDRSWTPEKRRRAALKGWKRRRAKEKKR
jgi:hypothetical protein